LLVEYDFRSQAQDCLQRAAELDPGNPRWPYFHGRALAIMHPTEAIHQFRRAAEICGNDPEAPRFRLARLLAEQGRWDEARREFEPLLKAKPGFTPARLLSARAAQAQGNLAGAIALARDCTSDSRTARSAWALLAILLRQQGDHDAAQHAAQRATAALADEGFGDPFEAEVTLLRGDPRSLSEQAHPLLAAGHWDAATSLIDQLVRQHPQYPDTWLLLGRLQFLRKDPAAAEKSLHHHLELSPQSAQGLFQLGLVLLAQNRFTESADAFDRATQLKTDYGPAYYNRALALARAGQIRPAMAAFNESIRYNPERADSYFLLADLCLRTGDTPRALQLLDQAQALAPADPRLRDLRRRATPASGSGL
jgi:tetratricopeptide (TPR) repeat protein